jgi:3-hydroxyisobutyrate dehydrogenase-like beta-hydroxyacid dehydrogenase
MSKHKLGWIGIGRMGAAMSTRLLAAGNDLVVQNRTRAKAEAVGAAVADRPVDLADRDIVFTTVAADQDLLDVVAGPAGLLTDPVRAPAILVDCSTVAASTSAEVRAVCLARGTEFLAAPISGNPSVVAAGESIQAVSGPKGAYDLARTYLEQISKTAVYVGEGEVARLVKICHNMMLGVLTQALAEITVLAEKGGVRRSALLDFLNRSVVGSAFTMYKSPAFVNLDFTPTFTPALLRKDFDIGMAAADDLEVSMPVSALCAEIVKGVVGAGYEGDFAVLLLEAARHAGLQLEPENVVVDDGLIRR